MRNPVLLQIMLAPEADATDTGCDLDAPAVEESVALHAGCVGGRVTDDDVAVSYARAALGSVPVARIGAVGAILHRAGREGRGCL